MNTPAKNFYNALKDNPEEIIKWCDEEIEQYEALKKLVKENIRINKSKK